MLFIIFINDLQNHMKRIHTHLYTDETLIYHSTSTQAELKDKYLPTFSTSKDGLQ